MDRTVAEARGHEEIESGSRERGAESGGEIAGGGSWKVFGTAEGFVIVVTAERGLRGKRRLPKDATTATRELRARFAKGAAPEIKRQILAERKAKLEAEAATSARAEPTKLTFKDVGDLWTSGNLTKRFPDHCPPKASVDADKSRLGHLNKTIGDVPIDEFTVDDAERAMQALPETCRTPATRRQYGGLIRRVMALSVYPLRIRPDNPIPKGFMPKAGKPNAVQWIYPSEEAQLAGCAALSIERRMLWGVLAREGMRDGSEAIALTWDCLDLERGTLRLDKNKTKVPRTWKLDPSVKRALAKWKKRRFGEEDPPPNARVLVDENGAAWEGARFAEMFRDDLKLAGVKRPELFEKSAARQPIRAHDLRSTFVTVKLAIGWTEAQISMRTGHQSSQMIARYRRIARTAEELEVGDFHPLDALLFGEDPKAPDPEHDPKDEGEPTKRSGRVPPSDEAASRGNDVPSDSSTDRSSRAHAMDRAPSIRADRTLNPLVSGSSPGWPTTTSSRDDAASSAASGTREAGTREGGTGSGTTLDPEQVERSSSAASGTVAIVELRRVAAAALGFLAADDIGAAREILRAFLRST